MSQTPPITPSASGIPDFGDLGPANQPRSWPKVVGIVSIVWGSLGLVCNGCGFVGNISQDAMMKMMPQPQGPDAPQIPPMPDAMKAGVVDIAGAALGFLLSALLIIAGSVLIARRPAGRTLHLAYAAVSILVTIFTTVFMVQKLNAMAAWAKQNPDNFWAQQNQSGFAMVGLFVGVVIGLAYPLFCLVWFLAVKKDTREITEGVEERVA